MEIRLMAFDLDGTLLDSEKRIPERNIRALRESEKRGIRLMLCSGRAFEVQTEFVREAGITPLFASANGARIDLDLSGKPLAEAPLDADLARHIYQRLMRDGVYFMAYARGVCYMANVDEQKRLKKHHHAPGVTMYGDLPYEITDDPVRIERECWKAAYKFICFGEDYDPRLNAIRESLAPYGVSMSSSWRDNLEIMRPGVDKGFAVRLAAERLGLSMDQVMVFGDNTNDAPMLRAAGWPVVMGNAEECVKPLARILAPDNDHAGVGQVIEEYVLNAAR